MLAKIAVLALMGVCAVSATRYSPELLTQFSAWQLKYKKMYDTTADFDHAMMNFKASIARVAAKNAASAGANWAGLTKFADLSPAEFKTLYLRATHTKETAKRMRQIVTEVLPPTTIAAPTSFDWRSHTPSVVSAVKDQGQCGSCWAFSTTENFESMYFLAGNKIPTLGPQQLVDCDPQSQGCGGGWTYWAFEYLLSVGGQETEANYPYTAQDGTCAFNAAKIAARLTNYTFATTPCESGSCPTQDNTLRHALATIGPLSICVNAEIWSDWTGPTPLPASECPGDADELDHCVQLVGYNWNSNYWIVRNSWNTDWGVAGYIYLQTGQNTCGLGDVVTFANVPKAATTPARHPHHRKH